MSHWRDRAAPIIANVIRTVGRSDMKALRRALRDAYPFGTRAMHPYRIWCDEVKRQLGHPMVKPRSKNRQQADLFCA
jgi:hypothetical protein